jgi:Reverse transcriptase (RNA-dependent DNA polymerase)
MAIKKLKNKKSPGPDKITNENIKAMAPVLLPHIKSFFNLCVEKGKVPNGWMVSDMKLLYKQKGDRDDVNSYRGIAVSNSLLNLLERALYARILSETSHIIPANQFGFVPGRSTLQAVDSLIREIESAKKDEKPLYVFFLDISKAFDTCSRDKVLENLVTNSNLSKKELQFIAELLKVNYYVIDDGVGRSEKISQTEGLKQGSVLSPLFYNISNHDINEAIKHLQGLKLISYADDTALASRDLEVIKQAILALITYFKDRNLVLNLGKCKVMKFTKSGRGRPKKTDVLHINGREIEFAREFVYLGVNFQPSGTKFSNHIEKRKKIALFATYDIPKLSMLSVETGLKLFDLKIAPILSYGIESIWQYLSKDDLHLLEKGKACFVRKLLSVDKSTRSRFTYSLVNCKLFVEQMKNRFNLCETEAYKNFYKERMLELENLPGDFFTLDAFVNEEWKGPQFKLRHVYTRFACHGFHHLVCKNKKYHLKIDANCVCELCENPCDRYHLKNCPKREKSLVKYATEKKK